MHSAKNRKGVDILGIFKIILVIVLIGGAILLFGHYVLDWDVMGFFQGFGGGGGGAGGGGGGGSGGGGDSGMGMILPILIIVIVFGLIGKGGWWFLKRGHKSAKEWRDEKTEEGETTAGKPEGSTIQLVDEKGNPVKEPGINVTLTKGDKTVTLKTGRGGIGDASSVEAGKYGVSFHAGCTYELSDKEIRIKKDKRTDIKIRKRQEIVEGEEHRIVVSKAGQETVEEISVKTTVVTIVGDKHVNPNELIYSIWAPRSYFPTTEQVLKGVKTEYNVYKLAEFSPKQSNSTTKCTVTFDRKYQTVYLIAGKISTKPEKGQRILYAKFIKDITKEKPIKLKQLQKLNWDNCETWEKCVEWCSKNSLLGEKKDVDETCIDMPPTDQEKKMLDKLKVGDLVEVIRSAQRDCPACKKSYNLISNPPAVEGKCECSADLIDPNIGLQGRVVKINKKEGEGVIEELQFRGAMLKKGERKVFPAKDLKIIYEYNCTVYKNISKIKKVVKKEFLENCPDRITLELSDHGMPIPYWIKTDENGEAILNNEGRVEFVNYKTFTIKKETVTEKVIEKQEVETRSIGKQYQNLSTKEWISKDEFKKLDPDEQEKDYYDRTGNPITRDNITQYLNITKNKWVDEKEYGDDIDFGKEAEYLPQETIAEQKEKGTFKIVLPLGEHTIRIKEIQPSEDYDIGTEFKVRTFEDGKILYKGIDCITLPIELESKAEPVRVRCRVCAGIEKKRFVKDKITDLEKQLTNIKLKLFRKKTKKTYTMDISAKIANTDLPPGKYEVSVERITPPNYKPVTKFNVEILKETIPKKSEFHKVKYSDGKTYNVLPIVLELTDEGKRVDTTLFVCEKIRKGTQVKNDKKKGIDKTKIIEEARVPDKITLSLTNLDDNTFNETIELEKGKPGYTFDSGANYQKNLGPGRYKVRITNIEPEGKYKTGGEFEVTILKENKVLYKKEEYQVLPIELAPSSVLVKFQVCMGIKNRFFGYRLNKIKKREGPTKVNIKVGGQDQTLEINESNISTTAVQENPGKYTINVVSTNKADKYEISVPKFDVDILDEKAGKKADHCRIRYDGKKYDYIPIQLTPKQLKTPPEKKEDKVTLKQIKEIADKIKEETGWQSAVSDTTNAAEYFKFYTIKDPTAKIPILKEIPERSKKEKINIQGMLIPRPEANEPLILVIKKIEELGLTNEDFKNKKEIWILLDKTEVKTLDTIVLESKSGGFTENLSKKKEVSVQKLGFLTWEFDKDRDWIRSYETKGET